ncbi:YfiR family protein [Tsuneonella suprasediminis]|uniref:YfiR family protein n=1 Tax=Tsuneonella suprasediminis TaxID=2306996 RepID=UPI002F9399D8
MMVPRALVCSPLRRIAWKRRGFALLAAPFLIAATGGITPVAMPVEPADSRAAVATAHLVRSILEYTRWPQQPDPINVCVVGRSRFGPDYPLSTLGNGVAIVRRNVSQANASTIAGCDVLYLGDIALHRARQWTAATRGAAVLTIAERDPQCLSESMFCLVYRQQTISFRINTDAIARSDVRIDPRVLRISRGG